jgi:hypothetical protein
MGFAHITWEDNMLETVKHMAVLGVRKIVSTKLNPSSLHFQFYMYYNNIGTNII